MLRSFLSPPEQFSAKWEKEERGGVRDRGNLKGKQKKEDGRLEDEVWKTQGAVSG